MPYAKEIGVLGDIPRHHGKTRGNSTAMVFRGEEIPYAVFDERCNQVANGLMAEGVKPQGRIAYLGKNAPSFFESLFGGAKANVVMVGINWRLAPPEVAYIVNDAKAEILFVGEEFFDHVERIRDEIPSVKRVITVSGFHDDWADYEEWRDAHSKEDPGLKVKGNDVAIQMYTSGTTGHPKGVQLSHDNFFKNPFFTTKDLEKFPELQWNTWTNNEVNLVCAPIFHIGGAGWGVTGFYHGANNVILSDFVPSDVLDAIDKWRCSKVFLVPAMIQFVLQDPKSRKVDYSCIDTMSYGASPIPLELLREAMEVFQCGFVQLYGMTETTGAATYLPPEDHDPKGNKRMRSAGKPIPGCELKVVDEDEKEVPTGEVGEICIKWGGNMVGYWNLPEETEKTMTDGWVHTGDAGFLDEDGYVYIHDRVKDMIVSGGENIYPAEVENAIFGHPAIAECAVIGVPDDRWGEAVKAIVVLREGKSATPEEIIKYTRERIAGYKVPKSVDFIDILPRNPSGKILKRELREPYWEGRDRRVN